MKKIRFLSKLLFSCLLFFLCYSSFAQASGDTIKTGKANDPMVVNPGTVNDSLSVNPGKPNDPMATMTDTGFINKNIEDNIMEIQMAKLGRDKVTSAAAKKVAGQMITDHTAILNDLRKLAVKSGAGIKDHDMPQALPNIPEGSDFTAKWASAMLTMHEAKIDELEKFMVVTQNKGLKAAIAKALPKIKMHRNLLAKIPGAKVTEDPNSIIH